MEIIKAILKTMAALFAIFLGLVVITVIALPFINWNELRPYIPQLSERFLGRAVRVDGNLDLGFAPHPFALTISADRITVDNANWGERDALVKAGHFSLDAPIWQSLTGQATIADAEIRDVTINLEKSPGGESNWTFGKEKEKKEEEPSSGKFEIPVVHKVNLGDIAVNYYDHQAGRTIHARIDRLTAGAPAPDAPMRVEGSGSLAKLPWNVKARFGSARNIQKDEPFPVAATLKLQGTKLEVDGKIAHPEEVSGIDLAFDANIVHVASLLEALGMKGGNIPTITASGELTGSREQLALKDFETSMGQSSLKGELALDTSTKRPRLSANLVSERLDIDELQAALPKGPETQQVAAGEGNDRKERKGPIIPDKPLPFRALRKVDFDAKLDLEQVTGSQHILAVADSAKIHAKLDHGQLTVPTLIIQLPKGRVEADMALNAAETPARLKTEVALKNVGLAPLAEALVPHMPSKKLEGKKLIGGDLWGAIKLASTGATPKQLASHLGGEITFAMQDGYVGSVITEALGLDLAEGLTAWFAGNPKTPIRCTVGNFSVNDGKIETRTMLIATKDANLRLSGDVDLASEKLDLTLATTARDFSVTGAKAPITIGGTFAKPKVGLKAGDIPKKALIAGALAAVAGPAAAAVGLIEPGADKGNACQKYVDELHAIRNEAKEEPKASDVLSH